MGLVPRPLRPVVAYRMAHTPESRMRRITRACASRDWAACRLEGKGSNAAAVCVWHTAFDTRREDCKVHKLRPTHHKLRESCHGRASSQELRESGMSGVAALSQFASLVAYCRRSLQGGLTRTDERSFAPAGVSPALLRSEEKVGSVRPGSTRIHRRPPLSAAHCTAG